MTIGERARVETFEHALGGGVRARRPAGPGVPAATLTRSLVGYRHTGVRFGAWLEPPRPEVTLMISLEGEITADGRALPGAWIGGLGNRPTIVGVGSTFAAIDLKLDPLRAAALLGDGLAELGGECVALTDACGADAAEMLERVHDARDWDGRFDAVETWLSGRAVRPGSRTADPAIARAFTRLAASAGRIQIAALADELRMSRRHLNRRFSAQLGLSPKATARQLRFAAVRRAVDAAPGAVSWAALAAGAGYADQAHLTREFRELAGITPTEFLARRMAPGGLVGDGL